VKKGIIIAGFGAIGKTTIGNKYNNVIDLDHASFKWLNEITEESKGTARYKNPEWPSNYYKALKQAQKEYDIILTSMPWFLIDYYEENNLNYHIVFPETNYIKIIKKRCYGRGNNKPFTDSVIKNLIEWRPLLKKYQDKLLYIKEDEYLEDCLARKGLLSLNVGFDIDYTLTIDDGYYKTFIENYIKENNLDYKYIIQTKEIKDMFDWSLEESKSFWRKERGNLIKEIPPNNKVIELLNEYKENGNNIYIITGRPTEYRDITIQWLEKNNVNYDELIMGDKLKLNSCLKYNVNIFYEDMPEVLQLLKGNNISARCVNDIK